MQETKGQNMARIERLIHWAFVLAGATALAAAFVIDHSRLQFAGFGALFLGIGLYFILRAVWRAELASELKRTGQLVQAEFSQVRQNMAYEVNGVNPVRIYAQWFDRASNTVHIFHSDNLWFDPTKFINGMSIPVYLDRQNFRRYHMDLSFLPKVVE